MSTASNKKPYTIHRTEIYINKEKLRMLIESKGIGEFMDLHEKIKDRYGLDISYKGFMSLLSNQSTWKLTYAWAIVHVLDVDWKDIFMEVQIDVEKKKKEKEKWKKNYQNKGK
ncbi:hypothetical protein FKN04_12830 [Bacillus glycinifermentans]|uniref:hypothetical protein n=1 Tax=Bacillus TaxID=1386 RepID=UPI001582848C|nr:MULTISPECIES: hypothetical protein [Bacillus]NUJ17460.1 hypothetical protein [Bacillus glycinifermentans]GIN67037.1 hypothetical protein J41TS2_24580 [Bacillus sonorensis]